ncbi:MAG: CoA pyrophosphatase [Rhodobiaceae bacterium]|nr:CoA pyrophosphatase [Rhodobiaceae bacterium]MCC0056383.1 CoA pyrophosphatase [Rhodobiaceae bacterium]
MLDIPLDKQDDYSPKRFVERVPGRLLDDPPPGDLDPTVPLVDGDHILNPDAFERLKGMSLRRAAVLVPVVARDEGATVILTQRPDHMPNHPGQIAFPGGKIEASDEGPAHAALREAEEEIGLDPSLVKKLGYLDLYMTGTGFRIVPLVGLVRPDYRLTLDPSEVTDAFEVPLSFLMSVANHKHGSRVWEGKSRHFYIMQYEERCIWGATAGILRNMYNRLYKPD